MEKQSGFKVEFGPVRADDLPEYLKTGKATPEMRQVKYTLKDRAVLIPVELNSAILPLIVSVIALYILGGAYPAIAAATAVLAGTALFPLALPWLPTKDFSSKGFILGAALALPLAAVAFLSAPASAMWLRVAAGLAYVLLMAPVTAYLALKLHRCINLHQPNRSQKRNLPLHPRHGSITDNRHSPRWHSHRNALFRRCNIDVQLLPRNHPAI